MKKTRKRLSKAEETSNLESDQVDENRETIQKRKKGILNFESQR
jgi:hypothetical protein